MIETPRSFPQRIMYCVVLLLALSLLYGCGAVNQGSSASTPSSPNPSTGAVSIFPKEAAVQAGNSLQFTARTFGAPADPEQAGNSLQSRAAAFGRPNSDLEWQVNGVLGGNSASGTISRSGLYTAPRTVSTNATIAVAVISKSSPIRISSAAVTVVPGPTPITVSVAPTAASLYPGQARQFTAIVKGTANQGISWFVNGTVGGNSSVGTISSSGTYTAPLRAPAASSVTITATSTYDTVSLATAAVTIVAASAPPTPPSTAKGGPVLPTLPQATVDTTMPVQTGTVRNVAAGNAAAFQAAINASTCGDTIVLVAGSTYTGNFTIPSKSCSGWILIESSALASLPPSGTRVSGACSAGTPPANVCPLPSTANMARIISSVANNPTITFQTAAHNWRLIGLEVTQVAGLHDYALVETENNVSTLSNLVSNLIIDRCYIHGTASGAVRRGVSFQVINGAIVDSDIREIHDQTFSPGQGSDSQAIAVWNSPGPLLIRNNFLSAASENVMFGGVDPSIANLVPSDITIVGNHFWKDWTAWHGKGYVVKNLLELKNAQRVLADGNVFDTVWADAQQGTAIMFTVRNQSGRCTWCVVQDISFTHNLVEHAGSGLETTPSDDTNPSLPENRILIQNDVFADISNGTFGGAGNGMAIFSGNGASLAKTSSNITVDHNDVFASNNILVSGDSGTVDTVSFTNILGLKGSYTFGGAGQYGSPSGVFSTFFRTYTYKDVLVLTSDGSSDGKSYPAGNTYFNSINGAGFTNYAGGNYQLTSGSVYRNAGTDGKDIGVWDWTTFNTETTNALRGIYPQ